MKTSPEVLREIERLFNTYSREVESARASKIIMDNTAKTYLLHSGNFVRWVKGEFEPGGRKINRA
jgi:hypothetical protein